MGLDVIQQAQSDTCKTATFCSGILQQLDYSLLECQALVLAPTHELVRQIEKVMRALGEYLQVKVHACVGGTSVREDQRILQSGIHVVVGTPGRVYNMLRRNALRADAIKCFVLDEADEMLSGGFKDQVCFSLSMPLVFFLLAKSVFFGGIKRLKYIIICEVYIFCALFDFLSAHFNGVYQ
jgi:translation initiation factor 4A